MRLELSRTLYLHIGFLKTGSSAIQAWLARNAAILARHGIAYRGFREDATRNRITSGNGELLLDTFAQSNSASAVTSLEFEQLIASYFFDDCDAAIVSNEHLADLPVPALEQLRDLCAAQQVSVSVLAYCRTIYDHCHSMYQQRVKRHGETGGFRDFAASYDNPQCRQLRAWHTVFGGMLHARLYDAARDDLIADFVRQAGISRLGLDTIQGNVNRSLASAELELLRRLNAYHGGILSTRLSDALIYENPCPKPDYPFDPFIAADLEQRFGDEVRVVSEQILAGERLAVWPTAAVQHAKASWRELHPALEPEIEIVLKALSEAAAEARQQERQLRVRFEIAQARIAVTEVNYAVAKSHLQRALQIDPDSPSVHRQLGEVFSRLGDHQRAQTHWRTATRLRESISAEVIHPAGARKSRSEDE